jgi:hypothetical protein
MMVEPNNYFHLPLEFQIYKTLPGKEHIGWLDLISWLLVAVNEK